MPPLGLALAPDKSGGNEAEAFAIIVFRRLGQHRSMGFLGIEQPRDLAIAEARGGRRHARAAVALDRGPGVAGASLELRRRDARGFGAGGTRRPPLSITHL